jgi:ribosome maturation factor RimP
VRDADTLVDTEVAIADIERARTVFEWGPADKPGKSPKNTTSKKSAKKSANKKSETKEPSQTEANAS